MLARSWRTPPVFSFLLSGIAALRVHSAARPCAARHGHPVLSAPSPILSSLPRCRGLSCWSPGRTDIRGPHDYSLKRLSASSMFTTFSAAAVPNVEKEYVEGLSAKILQGVEDGERLIDVRERNEIPFGQIPGSINIPLSEFVDALEKDSEFWKDRYGIPKVEPDDKVVVYCKSGFRSHQAAAYAAAKGYPNWHNYQGSYVEWFGGGY